MSVLEAIILGLVQGLTEFLPISSSGHLVISGELMGTNLEGDQAAMFTIAVHFGTLLSVVIYYRQRLMELIVGFFQNPMTREQWMVVLLLIATIPAVVVGFGFKDFFEGALRNVILASCMLLVTGVLILLPNFFRRQHNDVKASSALAMGIAQAFAILPGISRSGSTIAAGMISGVGPARAAEFSFLMAIPVILGGGALKVIDLMKQPELIPDGVVFSCVIGGLVAFVSGLIAIYAVLGSIRKGKFQYFAIYCFLVGLTSIVYFGFIKPGESTEPAPEVAALVDRI